MVLLWGAPGDPIIDLAHLKQPAEPVGPFSVKVDHLQGKLELHNASDLRTFVAASAAGVTVRETAVELFGMAEPDRNQIERARRKLDTLHEKGAVEKLDGPPMRYRARGG